MNHPGTSTTPSIADKWTINAFYREGTLSHSGRGTIYFGAHMAPGLAGMTRIDLRKMAHGMDDSPEKAIPSFIAAADLLHQELAKASKVAINCSNGNSRTAFALITFLIRHERFDYKRAAELIERGQKQRTDINFKLVTTGPNGSYNEWISSDINSSSSRIPNLTFSADMYYNVGTSQPVIYHVEPPKQASKRKRPATPARALPTPKRYKATSTKTDKRTVAEGKQFLARVAPAGVPTVRLRRRPERWRPDRDRPVRGRPVRGLFP